MGKKIKKVVKKVTKAVVKVADPAGVIKEATGGNDAPAQVVEAPATPTPVAAPAPVSAAVVEAPKDTTEGSDDADTEAAKKAARARGKRGLSVARSAGTGINI